MNRAKYIAAVALLLGILSSSPTLACIGAGPAPTADIVGPSAACINAQVSFAAANPVDKDWDNGLVTDSVRSYSWNFGDGGTASGQSVSHTYTTAGNYTVSLTLDDSVGGSYPGNYVDDAPNTVTKGICITRVTSITGPQALYSGELGTYCAQTSPSGSDPVTWGGGGSPATGSGQCFSTMWAPGTYSVTATCGTTVSLPVTVTGPPAPPPPPGPAPPPPCPAGTCCTGP
jgi:hypothetical protein